MKYNLILRMTALTLFVVSFQMTGCQNYMANILYQHKGERIPPFELLMMDSSTLITSERFPGNKPILLFYFDPRCPYCRAQTKDILGDKEILSTFRIYFISNGRYEYLRSFVATFNINRDTSITVAMDKDNWFKRYFRVRGVPFMAVYAVPQKLIAEIEGRARVYDILNLLKK
jgi:thioredoxin-related protein